MKVNCKHHHVKADRQYNQTKRSRSKMSHKNILLIKIKESVHPSPLIHVVLTFDIRVFPQSSHKFLTVDVPMVAIVNNPTHLQLTVSPNPAPVAASQKYHQN